MATSFSGTEIPFMVPSVQSLRGTQAVCSWGHAASPRGTAPRSLLVHISFTCGHLVMAQQSAKTWAIWPHVHMALRVQSPPYPINDVLLSVNLVSPT